MSKLLSPEEIKQLLGELAGMLEEMDPDAEEKVLELKRGLGNRADQRLMWLLEQQVSGFEFEKAVETLPKLRASLY